MDMKAMMYAGGGLFLSMVATTMWISGDVTRMREEEQARRDATCATTTPSAATDPTDAPAAIDTMPPSDPVAGEAAGAAACPPTEAAGEPEIDPNTGLPIEQDAATDPYAQSTDPAATDPYAEGGTTDPYAEGGSTDPYAEGGSTDPYAQGGTTDPYAGDAYPASPATAPSGTAVSGAGF